MVVMLVLLYHNLSMFVNGIKRVNYSSGMYFYKYHHGYMTPAKGFSNHSWFEDGIVVDVEEMFV